MPENIDVSIVIVNWNTKRMVLDCLQSIYDNPCRYHLEVIVVDNASSDGSADAIAETFSQVILIRNTENLGFGKANNQGIAQCRGRYISLINSDVIVLEDCLENLVSFMDADPDIGMAGPRLLWPDKTLQWSCRRFPSLWIQLCGALGLSKLFPNTRLFGTEHMTYFAHDRVKNVDALVGAFMLLRREVTDRIGGFDERFFMYGEDVDLCKRVGDAGWKITFFPGSQAIHIAGGSSSRNIGRFLNAKVRSEYQLWEKHYGPRKARLLTFLVSIKYGLRYMAAWLSSVIFRKPKAQREMSMQINTDIMRLAIELRATKT